MMEGCLRGAACNQVAPSRIAAGVECLNCSRAGRMCQHGHLAENQYHIGFFVLAKIIASQVCHDMCGKPCAPEDLGGSTPAALENLAQTGARGCYASNVNRDVLRMACSLGSEAWLCNMSHRGPDTSHIQNYGI